MPTIFVDAYINGSHTRAYMDFGSECVTITKELARERGLIIDHHNKIAIQGYGAGRIYTLGCVEVTLKIEDVEVCVRAEVVPTGTQEIPLLNGQPFTELPGVTVIKDHQQLNILSTEDPYVSNLNISPSRRIVFWAKEATVFPPNSLRYVWAQDKDKYSGVPFIEPKVRGLKEQLNCISASVLRMTVAEGTMVPLVNISRDDLVIREGRLITRAWPCIQDKEEEEALSWVQRTHTVPLTALNRDDIITGAAGQVREDLIELLSKYRECFATNLSELGLTQSL